MIKAFNLAVYFVADPSVCGGRALADVVERAVCGGATMVQLRSKGGDMEEIAAQGRALLEILKGTDVPLIINDHVEIAARIGADGAHIGQGDMKPQAARDILGPGAILGLTAFTPEHFMALDERIVDYAGTGPFYATRTKPDKLVLGPEEFGNLVALSPVPVVGIGGITPGNAAQVMACGAAGVAMMRGISQNPDPESAARMFRQIIAQFLFSSPDFACARSLSPSRGEGSERSEPGEGVHHHRKDTP